MTKTLSLSARCMYRWYILDLHFQWWSGSITLTDIYSTSSARLPLGNLLRTSAAVGIALHFAELLARLELCTQHAQAWVTTRKHCNYLIIPSAKRFLVHIQRTSASCTPTCRDDTDGTTILNAELHSSCTNITDLLVLPIYWCTRRPQCTDLNPKKGAIRETYVKKDAALITYCSRLCWRKIKSCCQQICGYRQVACLAMDYWSATYVSTVDNCSLNQN